MNHAGGQVRKQPFTPLLFTAVIKHRRLRSCPGTDGVEVCVCVCVSADIDNKGDNNWDV